MPSLLRPLAGKTSFLASTCKKELVKKLMFPSLCRCRRIVLINLNIVKLSFKAKITLLASASLALLFLVVQ